MKIQIVIPVINLWDKYTKQCIESLKSKNHEIRILLIDNASNDETSDEAGKLVSNTFAHKRNEDRWSCAKSWNYGIRDAWERGFDYVLVINNDVILNPYCIDELVERFRPIIFTSPEDIEENLRKAEKVVMVTALDVRGQCTEPTNVLTIDINSFINVLEAPHPNFSCFMINKKCWDTVGEFDEGFTPAYYEDNDYHRRIKLAGLEAIVYPPALFYHYGSGTSSHSKIDSSGAHKYFISKWGGNPDTPDLYKYPLNNSVNTIKSVKQNNYENR